MSSTTPNIDDLTAAMSGDESPESTDAVTTDSKNPGGNSSILTKAKKTLAKWGVPAAVVAVVVALAIYLVRTEITAGLVRSLKAKGASTVIGGEIRNRVKAHANGYRVLGLIANLTKEPSAQDVNALFEDLQPSIPTTDKQGFLDALAVHIESQTMATGLDDLILTMVVEGKDNDAIDDAILKQMQATLKEQDLKRLVSAILSALTADLKNASDTRIPKITSAVDQVELAKLLTAPTDDDFTATPADETAANAEGVIKGQAPFKGLAVRIKAKLGGL